MNINDLAQLVYQVYEVTGKQPHELGAYWVLHPDIVLCRNIKIYPKGEFSGELLGIPFKLDPEATVEAKLIVEFKV